MNNNPLDKFEQGIQEAYKNYELPYSSSEFAQVSRRLLRKRLLSGLALWGSVAAITALVGISGYMILSNETKSSLATTPNAPEITNTVTTPNSTELLSGSASDGISEIISDFNKDIVSKSTDQENDLVISEIGRAHV